MSDTPRPGPAAGSRRFWVTVLVFALLNAAAWVAYHRFATPKLQLLRVTRFEPTTGVPVGPRPTLSWEFNLDVAHGSADHVPGSIAPHVAGKWLWHDGRTLTFTPDADLPRATRFTVTLPSDRLRTAEGIRLDKPFSATFTTEPLQLLSARQAGCDEERRLLIELAFNDAVSPAEAVKHLKLADGRTSQPISFHLNGEATGKVVRVQTDPVPQLTSTMKDAAITLSLSEGLASASGPLGIEKALTRAIPVAVDLMATEATAAAPSRGNAEINVRFNNTIDLDVAHEVITVDPPADFRVSSCWDANASITGAFEPGKRYLVKIAEPPAGADRRKYPRADALSVFIPDRREEVWFEHTEGYLGSNGNRTLLAHAVNVPQVRVTVTRLYDNNLVAWRNASPGGERWEDTADLSAPIAEQTITLPKAKNRTNDLRLSLDDLLPADAPRDGVYRVGLTVDSDSNAPRHRRSWRDDADIESASSIVTLSDVGLTAKRSRDAVDVWAVSLSTAKPLADVRVRAYSNKNQLLGEGRTKADGLLHLASLHPAAGEHAAVLVAERIDPNGPRLAGEAEKAAHAEAHRDLTWLDLRGAADVNLATADTAGRPYLRSGYEAFLFTERGVYRPGETAHLRALVRGPNLSTPGEFPVKWQLRRPDLRDWQSQTVTLAPDGAAALDVKLPDDLPTGRWTADLQMPGERGAALGTATFFVEDFIPNRMKVKLDVATDGAKPATSRLALTDAPVRAELQADYLFGQPVAGRPATLTIRTEPATFAPANWSGWTFGDSANTAEVFHGKQAVGGRIARPPVTLDAHGHATWKIDPDELLNPEGESKAQDYPGPWRVTFYAAAIENGGRAVSVSKSIDADRLASYVGIQAQQANPRAGAPCAFEFVRVTPAGQPVAAGGEVQLQLYREVWNTSLVEQHGHYGYVSTRKLDHVGKPQRLALHDGLASYAITPPTGGAFVLTAKDLATGYTSSIRFFADAGAWDDNVSREDPEKVELILAPPPASTWETFRQAAQHPTVALAYNAWHHGTLRVAPTGEPTFRPGGTAQVLVRSPFAGRLLLSVETDAVLSTQVIDMPASQMTATIKLPDDSRPNAYVTATVIRAINPNARWQTHRAFGITRAAIDNSDRKLAVQIAAPPEIRPDTSLDLAVKVTGATGRPAANAAVTVLAVDEGILSLTNCLTPDPFAFFNGRRAHGVKWSDLYSQLMPEVAKPQRSSEVGGDKGDAPAGRHSSPVAAKRVKPVAFISGVLHTDGDGLARADFHVPDFSGQLRVMAIASSRESFGSAQSSTLVRSPLLIQASWPRFAAPGDRFTVPITIFNRTSQPGPAKITIELQPTEKQPPAIRSAQSIITSAPIAPGGSTTVNIDVTANDVAAVAHILVTASMNGETARDETELPVRPASPEISVGGYATVTPNHPTTLPAMPDFLPGTRRLQVTLSPMPSLELPRGLDYLDRYPYGCAEQTISGCLPLLALGDLGPHIAPDLFSRPRVEEKLQTGLTRLIGMQCADGGIAMWPGSRESWPWASVYAAQLLVETASAKHPVPAEFRDSLFAYVRNLLTRSADADDLVEVQAYACYVLALAGKPERAVMSRLTEIVNHPRDVGHDHSPEARFHLAAAWLAAGRRDLAEGLIPQTLPQPRSTRQLSGNVGSPVRDRAALLSTLLDVDPNRPELPALAQQLADAGRDGRWQSTQDAAFAVVALAKYLRTVDPGSPYEHAELNMAGKPIGAAESGQSIHVTPTSAGGLTATIAGPAKAKGHLAWLFTGVPMHPPVDEDAGLSIRRRYLDASGRPLSENRVRSGELVQVELSLESPTALANLVIDDLLPAGLEVENAHLATSAQSDEAERKPKSPERLITAARVDARDDRVILVGGIPTGGTYTFTYLARAVTPGTFVIPPVRGECMYDIGTHSLHGGGQTLTVVPWTGKAMATAE